MKKLRFILMMLAFAVAFGSAVLTSAKTEAPPYYRWNPANMSQCIEEDECDEGVEPCGHNTFVPTIGGNCLVPVELFEI